MAQKRGFFCTCAAFAQKIGNIWHKKSFPIVLSRTFLDRTDATTPHLGRKYAKWGETSFDPGWVLLTASRAF
jgi:hypothetical protein